MRNLPKSELFGKIQKSQPMIRKCQNPTWIVGGTRPKSGLFKKLYIQKMGLYDPGMSIQYRLGDHPIRHTSPFENPVSKKASTTLLKWFPIWLFWAKKGEIIGPGPGQKEIQIPQKNLSNQGWHCFRFLCILLVPNALPKRERSLWLPPQNVLRQGWLGHYYKSFPDNWNQVFLR